MRGLFLLLLTFQCVTSNWWFTSQFNRSSSVDSRTLCSIMPGLSRRQRQICIRDPDLVLGVAEGVRQAIQECQFQFRFQKWNCTTFPDDVSVFGKRLVKGGTREVAVIEAITSAAATLTLSRHCARGSPHCSCSVDNWAQFQAHRLSHNMDFKWKGCEDDLKFSMNFVRRLSDAQDNSHRDIKAMTTKHNSRVGRHILQKNIERLCKCHGLSGSCSLRTCWQSLTNIRTIGNHLREKYDGAIEVIYNPSGKPIPVQRGQRSPHKTDLMYYEKSKDFCTMDSSRGILGTHRRPCQADSQGEESCDILCCGQEYTVVRTQHLERCNCHFKWCCAVECDTCNVTKYNSYCI